jgi:hypothetical protein
MAMVWVSNFDVVSAQMSIAFTTKDRVID